MYHMSAQGVDQRMINVHDDHDHDDDDLRVVFHVHSCVPLYRSSWCHPWCLYRTVCGCYGMPRAGSKMSLSPAESKKKKKKKKA